MQHAQYFRANVEARRSLPARMDRECESGAALKNKKQYVHLYLWTIFLILDGTAVQNSYY